MKTQNLKGIQLLKSENNKCRNDVNEHQQYLRMDSLEITGCPETKNEDVYMILESIAHGIGVPFIKNEISIAHGVPARQQKTKQIICKFVSR